MITLEQFYDALWRGEAQTLYPAGTEIADKYKTSSSADATLIVAHYLTGEEPCYGGAEGAVLIRKCAYSACSLGANNVSYNYTSSSGKGLATQLETHLTEHCSDELLSMLGEIRFPFVENSVNGKVGYHTARAFIMSKTEMCGEAVGYSAPLGVPFDYWKMKTQLDEPSDCANEGRVVKRALFDSTVTYWTRDCTSQNSSCTTNGATLHNATVCYTTDGHAYHPSITSSNYLLPAFFIPSPREFKAWDTGNYGCQEDASASCRVSTKLTSVTYDKALKAPVAHIDYEIALTVSNVNYTEQNIDQDPSAWIEFMASGMRWVQSLHTFVPREDCSTGFNKISGSIDIPFSPNYKMYDKSIWCSAVWSGYRSQWDDGMGGYNIYLSDDMFPTPPQNLQVTFDLARTGDDNKLNIYSYYDTALTFTPVLENWSSSAEANEPSDDWSWQWELVDGEGKFVYDSKTFTNDINNTKVTVPLTVFSPMNVAGSETGLVRADLANVNYRVRVTARNIAGEETSIMSPIFTTPPPKMTFSKLNGQVVGDGRYAKIAVQYGIGPNMGHQPIHYSVTPVYNNSERTSQAITGVLPAGQTDGLPMSNNTLIEFDKVPVNAHGVGMIGRTWYEGYENIKMENYYSMEGAQTAPKLSYTFPSDNLYEQVTITATITSTSSAVFAWRVGYTEGGDDVISLMDYEDWGSGAKRNLSGSITITDLPHGKDAKLYVRAYPITNGRAGFMTEHEDNYGAITIPIPDPIHGVVKTCDSVKHIVDIVERKDNVLGEQWKNGKKVVVVKECTGAALSPDANVAACGKAWGVSDGNSYAEAVRIEDGCMVIPAGSYPAPAKNFEKDSCGFPLSLFGDDIPKLNNGGWSKVKLLVTAENPSGFDAITMGSSTYIYFSFQDAGEQYIISSRNDGASTINANTLVTARQSGGLYINLSGIYSSARDEGHFWTSYTGSFTVNEDLRLRLRLIPLD